MAKSAVILGAGMGGLSAAIHARLNGYDVLVLEKSDRVGGKAAGIVQEGFRLDPGPSIIILTRIYEAVFRSAGRRMEDYLRFHRLDPFTRVFFEGQPALDLPADRSACEALVGDIAPGDAAAFRNLMATLDEISPHIDKSVFDHPYHTPLQLLDRHLIATGLRFDVRKTYREMVDGWFKSPLLRAFFYGFPSYGGQSYDSKAPGALMIPYLMLQEGVWYPEGGVAAIPEAFYRLARELGVEFRFGARVASLQRNGSRIRAVVLEGGEGVEGDAFISNVDRLTTRQWLGHTVDWRPSLSYFTVHWGLRKPMPELLHHTLLVPADFERGFEELYRDRTFPTRPITYVNETNGVDPSTAPPGRANVFAVITSPANEPQLEWEARIPEYRERVRGELGRFGFGIDDDDIVMERVQSPLYFQETHGNYLGSLYGPDEAHRVMGLFPLRIVDEDYRNLFYCGGSVQPGAGLPMVTLSGKFAAEALP